MVSKNNNIKIFFITLFLLLLVGISVFSAYIYFHTDQVYSGTYVMGEGGDYTNGYIY